MASRSDCGQRIHAVVRPHLLPGQAPEHPALPGNLKTPLRIRFARLPAPRHAETLHRGPASLLEHSPQSRVSTVRDNQPGAWHDPDKVMELALDRCKIGEDVGMIELQVVQYCSAGVVVDKLRALVEEGGVVFVSLDDEQRRAGKPGRSRETQG